MVAEKSLSAPQTIGLGVADDSVLQVVHRYSLVTAEQVCRALYKPGNLSYARQRLASLAEKNFLVRRHLPRPSRTGSAPIVYGVGPKGQRYLATLGLPVAKRLRLSDFADAGYLHLRHALATTDFLIAADLFTRDEPTVQLVELLHDRQLRSNAAKVRLPDGSKLVVVPDAWLDMRIRRPDSKHLRFCVALELDRGSEHQPAWRRKIQGLLAWASGPYVETFGTESLTIAVVTTADDERLGNLLRWTEAELKAGGQTHQADLFWFTSGQPSTMRPRTLFAEPIWHIPFQSQLVALLTLNSMEAHISA